MFLGLPARVAAHLTGTDNALMQEYARQQGQRAPVTNFLGTLAGSVFTGGGLVRGGAALARGLARSGAPVLARTGQALQAGGNAMTLRRGENLRNAGRLAAGGAAYGAADSAVRDENILEGAGYGAGGAVALGAGVRLARVLGGRASEALRVSGADAMLRRNINLTKEQLQRRYDDFRARTGGGNPTVYELLDADERAAMSEIIGRLKPQSLERASAMSRARVNAVPREVAQVVQKSTRSQRRSNIENLVSAQAASRDASTPTIAETRLAVGAADNPTRLAQIRRNEAKNIMQPFDERKAVDTVEELVPTELRAGSRPGQIVEEETAAEISKAIRSAAGSGRLRSPEKGLSVSEVTDMISALKEDAANSTRSRIERNISKEAAEHIQNVLVSRHPDMAPALARMNAAWAARSRQLEGMGEIRTQADFDVRRPKGLNESEKIFETPEGAVGRQAGQRRALLDDLNRRPDVALGTVRNLAEDITEQRRIAKNIGRPAQREISQAAREQVESIRRLAKLVRDPDFRAKDLTAGDLAILGSALNPGAMAITQARGLSLALRKIAEAVPETNRRAVIVDMLLSRDPAMIQRAIDVLGSRGPKGDAALREFILAVVGGAQGQNLFTEEPSAPMPADADAETEMPEFMEGPAESLPEKDEYAEFADKYEDFADEYAEFADKYEDFADEYAEFGNPPLGERVISELFPDAVITDSLRDPDSDLGRRNPGSHHIHSDGAVDVRPIPGMTFDEFVNTLRAEGYDVIEAKNEVGRGRSGHATGDHWHVVIRERQ
jgi:hypothetical protein